MRLARRLRSASRPERVHHEIAEELQFHIDRKTEELMARGVEPAEAKKLAQRSFGATGALHEEGYLVRGGGWVEELLEDGRFAWRLLRKTPVRTAVLVATLALGIGVNTTVFSLLHAILLEPLPFASSSRLVTIHQATRENAGGVSYPHYLDWRARNHSFAALAVYGGAAATYLEGDRAERLNGATVSANLFALLGVEPLAGRLFLAAEDRRGEGPEGSRPLLISERFWRTRFGAKTNAIGKRCRLDRLAFEIVGIIPDRMTFPVQSEPIDYWTTVAVDAEPSHYGGSIPVSRGYPRYDGAIGRLNAGVSLSAARADMNALAAVIARESPNATSMNEVRIESALDDVTAGTVHTLLWILYGAVCSVLLVAAINVAALQLVAITAREKEFAVRLALGARAGRLIRQLLAESFLLAAGGCAAGLVLALFMIEGLLKAAPAGTPRLEGVHLSGVVLLYAMGITTLTAFTFGLAPAAFATRAKAALALRSGARTAAPPLTKLRWGTLLIAGQIAVSLTLTCAASVLASSFLHIINSPRGFEPHGVITASVSLPVALYPQNSAKVYGFYDELLRRLRRHPSVQLASIAERLPLSGQSNSTTVRIGGDSFRPDIATELRFVEQDYFRTLAVPLLQGRLFAPRDQMSASKVVIVNRAFVHRYLPEKEPCGSTIRLGWGGSEPKQIVGVVGDVLHDALSPAAAPEAYVPYSQFPLNDMFVVIRTTDASRTVAALRQELGRLDRTVPLTDIKTLNEYLLASAGRQRFLTVLLTSFAAATLLLAVIGLYGVLSFATTRRYQEFGIRMALGSSRWRVMKLVLLNGAGLIAFGVLIGWAMILGGHQLLSAWLYQTEATDARAIGLSVLILLLAALTASFLPARRATKVDPLTALRAE